MNTTYRANVAESIDNTLRLFRRSPNIFPTEIELKYRRLNGYSDSNFASALWHDTAKLPTIRSVFHAALGQERTMY
jgi:hypothetical protein